MSFHRPLRKIGLTRTTIYQIKPPPKKSSFEFIKAQVRNHKGEPFNAIDFPWTKGICDAYDDPYVRTISLQFAARIGKTQLAQSLMVASIARDPNTFMFASATETLVKETVRDKYYPMFERCATTRPWTPPKGKRIQSRIDLANCRGYTGWSGSPTSLADKDPKFLHGGEIDKFTKNSSEEADSLEIFLERGLEIPDRKAILESTPSIKGRSRIEQRLKTGWNCQFHVPCPKCKHYQPLILGDGKVPGGIIFDKDEHGRLDKNIAYRTARYQCCNCKFEIDDEARRPMIRQGVWCPEGQYVDKKGRLQGTMLNPGPDASFQLSRIYAPTFTFGDIARQFVVAHTSHNEEMIRNFKNSWLGETWQPVLISKPWEDVGKDMAGEYDLGTVPAGVSFLTMAVDVQIDHWVFMVVGWAAGQKGYVIDYGQVYAWEEVTKKINTQYPANDGGLPFQPMMTLIDARDGNRTDEVTTYCKSVSQQKTGPWVWPCMGSKAGQMGGNAYKKTNLDDADQDAARKKKPKSRKRNTEFGWVTVNTNYWQQWIHNCLYRRKSGEALSLAIPRESARDRDLIEQLMNEAPDFGQSTTGQLDKLQWVVVSSETPVDLRDTARYARCAAEVYLRGNWARVPKARPMVNVTPSAIVQQQQQQQNTPTRTKIPRPTRPGWVRKLSNSRIGRK